MSLTLTTGNALQVAAAASGMSQEEMKSCRVFFNNFDRSKSGLINSWELQIALEAMGQNPDEHSIRALLQQLGAEKTQSIDFTQFLKAIQMQRELEKRQENEEDFLAAFVAMGGNPDHTGAVSSDKLRRVIKEDFGLTLKIDEALEDLDTEADGMLNYQEFKQLFS